LTEWPLAEFPRVSPVHSTRYVLTWARAQRWGHPGPEILANCALHICPTPLFLSRDSDTYGTMNVETRVFYRSPIGPVVAYEVRIGLPTNATHLRGVIITHLAVS
jgi:hypothetical protein